MDADVTRLINRMNALEAIVLSGRKPPEGGTVTVTGSAALTSAHLFVGNATNIATDTAVTGDVTISNAGVTAIGANKVTFAQMQAITDGTMLGASGGTAVEQITIGTGLNLASNILTATGGGTGGAGSIYPSFTAPVDGNYTWGNQNGASTSTYSNGALSFTAPASGADQIMMRGELAITSNYTFTLGFLPSLTRGAEQHAGIYARDSVGGKIKVFARYVDSGADGLIYYKWNSTTSFSAVTVQLAASVQGFVFMRLEDNATNIIASFSVDGQTFIPFATETRTTFCTPDKIGATLRNHTSVANGMTIYHWVGP